MKTQAMDPALPSPAAQPLIGTGRVWHQRLRPVQHAFSYASYFLLLPMRTLAQQPSAALRRNRFGALSFYDRDHGDGGDDALAWLEQLLEREKIHDALGEVWLHTLPRVLGYTFKPVSIWYAHRHDGTLAAVVAEVNNTFGERHCYLLAGDELAWGRVLQARKVFHVSPFCAVLGSYSFRFELSLDKPQAQHTAVRIDHADEAGPLLQTAVSGKLVPLSAASARRAFWGMPLMTFTVVARIHWQALRLLLKRVPFHRQPPAPERFVTR
jgi:DUF1365 family protein